MWKKTTLTLLTLALAVGPVAAGNDTQWLHVAVDDEPDRVRMNIPLNLVEAVLPLIEDTEFRHGHMDLDGHHVNREDIVNILRELEAAEDGEYLTVEDPYDTVRVAKEGDFITVQVNEQRRHHSEQVDIKVPVAVLEALVSGKGDELNLVAAVRALGEHGEGDLITVDDDGTKVRIWIDDQNTPAEAPNTPDEE